MIIVIMTMKRKLQMNHEGGSNQVHDCEMVDHAR